MDLQRGLIDLIVRCERRVSAELSDYIIVDILQVLLDAKKSRKAMNSEEVRERVIKLRKSQKLTLKGVASSNVRRQLKRLRDIFLVEKIQNEYRIIEFEELHILFEKRIKEVYLKSILERVSEYFNSLK